MVQITNTQMELFESFGIIPGCDDKTSVCKHKCCVFTDNYILLYPGEYEDSGLDRSHLEIIDVDHLGGGKARCSINPCDQEIHLKPLECKSYPFFPRVDKEGKIQALKAERCPLTEEDLVQHKELFLKVWELLLRDKKILDWLKKAQLSGDYKLVE